MSSKVLSFTKGVYVSMYMTASDLSKYYWKLVDNGAVPTIKFSIVKRVKGNTLLITETYV